MEINYNYKISQKKQYKVQITLFRREIAYISVDADTPQNAIRLAEKVYNSEKDECLENKSDEGYDKFFFSNPEEIKTHKIS